MFSEKIKIFNRILKHYKGQVWIDEEGEVYLHKSIKGNSYYVKYADRFDGKLDPYLAVYTAYDEKRRLRS